MLDARVESALNEQINHELASAYLYLSMAAHFEAANLPGSAAWMRRQVKEEQAHAMKIFDYVNDRDGRVRLQALAQPPGEFGSTLEVWEGTLTHEQRVSGLIHALYALAVEAKDYPTQALMQWFVTEQVEEEKTARTILEQVRKIGTASSAIFFLDRHLGKEAEEKA
ncbi:MAG: ferritin [Gemmatimonadales bacterium]